MCKCDLCGSDLFESSDEWGRLQAPGVDLDICPACVRFVTNIPLRYYRSAQSEASRIICKKKEFEYLGERVMGFNGAAVIPGRVYGVTVRRIRQPQPDEGFGQKSVEVEVHIPGKPSFRFAYPTLSDFEAEWKRWDYL